MSQQTINQTELIKSSKAFGAQDLLSAMQDILATQKDIDNLSVIEVLKEMLLQLNSGANGNLYDGESLIYKMGLLINNTQALIENAPKNLGQEFLDIPNAVGNIVWSVDLTDYRTVSVQMSGFTAPDVVQFEASNNGVIWTQALLTNTDTATSARTVTGAAGNATYRAIDQGLRYVRGRVTTGNGLSTISSWTVVKR